MTQTKKPRPEAAPSLRDRSEEMRARVAEDRPVDPVLAVIRDGRKLLADVRRASLLPNAPDDTRPQAENDAIDALMAHLHGPLMGSPPTTPVGAVELAKYAVDLHRLIQTDLLKEMFQVLEFIAQVRLG